MQFYVTEIETRTNTTKIQPHIEAFTPGPCLCFFIYCETHVAPILLSFRGSIFIV
jgi:hypothetical protein